MTEMRKKHLLMMTMGEIENGFRWGTVSNDERDWWFDRHEEELLARFGPRVRYATTSKGESYDSQRTH
jgi:hypothetical protein